MESVNPFNTESSFNVFGSNVITENESNFYQPPTNEKMLHYSDPFSNFGYMGSPNLDYGLSQQVLFKPYGYYNFDGNVCEDYKYGMYSSPDFNEVGLTEYYTPEFTLPMHPSAFKCMETDMNLVSIPEYRDDTSSWVPEITGPYYNEFSNLCTGFSSYGITNAEEQAHFEVSDSYVWNRNSNYFDTGNIEPAYFPLQEYTSPYAWYPPEVPGYYGYEMYDHVIVQNEDLPSKI
ncbi:UNVERIFIED_CONTAM: hypothetical protein RMT77_017713 [Armadillidium vulgare]